MLSKVDRDNVWPASGFNKEEDMETKPDCRACSNAHLTEQDYLGLSKTYSLPVAQEIKLVHSEKYDGEGEGLMCGDTELRLGIGPTLPGDTSLALTHQLPTDIERQIINGSDPGVRHPCGNVLMNTAMELGQSFWPCMAQGMFAMCVPKVSTAPGKRPFIEIGSENGDDSATSSDFPTKSITQSEAASKFRVAPKLSIVAPSRHPGLYTWSNNCVNVASWPSNLNASAMSANTYTSAANRSPPSLPAFKLPPALPAGQHSAQPQSTPDSAVALHSSSSFATKVSLSGCNGQEDGRMSKAPVVGWPPVRSFRKNTLHSTAATAANKASNASFDALKHEDANNITSEAGGEQNRVTNKDTLFVKAKLDGVRICRKVDLTSHNNYESLKSALQEMFQGFVCNDDAKLDLLQGKHYVLTHEDKDGDWMLVGDVPWDMFVATVKSLRIMKAVDAVGLGGKVFAKLRAQDTA